MANISRCQYLLSSISAESFTGSGVSLEIQMMELWWWLQGDCRCSKDAICTQVESPAGSGFRCQCRDGLVGDGYLAGVGCRKASAGCNSAKYLSGKCGGGSGVAVLLGGVVAGVGVSLGLFCCLIRRNSASKAKSHMDNIEQVMNEIKLISSVSHPNLVRLLGCSIEMASKFLSMNSCRMGRCASIYREREVMDLTGLYQVEQHTLRLPLQLQVADFGLSRHGMTEISHISTAPQGTPGYLDPQYHQNFHLSDKIITAKKVVDFSRPQNEVNLAALAADKISRGRLDEIIDPFLDLHSDAWTFSSVHKVAEVAFRCLAFHKDMRPSMVEVAAELEQIMLSRWASSEETNCPTSLDFSPKNRIGEKRFVVLQTQPSGKSPEVANRNSPVSVQDPWLSEKSSPSSSNLLNNVIIK
ncbi:wall-associated receptor kinase [Salix suchowensis]|nr:wall-associated receptor kinase [Salix suchowensis]